MENEAVNKVYLAEVEKEYAQIHNNWLKLHFKITIGVVVFALFVECMMSLLFMDSDVITISLRRYLIKYIAIPSGLNLLLIGLETIALKTAHLSQEQKIYLVSFTFVFICFIVFCAHSALTSTYYIFTGAVMLTIIYANYHLTCLTALLSVISIVLSELVIKWDADKPDVLANMENQETDRTWVLVTADLDHFKGINDNWGHSIGDRCLKEFARILKENEMKYTSFRYGGDEFCLLFADAVIEEAVYICDRIRSQVEKVCVEGVQSINLTASFGIAAYSPDIDGARLFIHSDQALYEAKKCRNAIFVYDESKMATKPMGR